LDQNFSELTKQNTKKKKTTNMQKVPDAPKAKGKRKKAAETNAKFRHEFDHPNTCKRIIYDSTADLQTHFNDEVALRNWLAFYCQDNPHWLGSTSIKTADDALAACLLGSVDNVELIRAEREKAERINVQTLIPQWERDLCGSLPDVGAAVAGDPVSMRRLVNVPTDTRPIRIFVGMASSCTFSADQLAKRGALISALALQLQRTRSVDVYAVNSGRDSRVNYDWSILVKLPKPLCMADLSYWLCSQASVRGLLYAYEKCFTGDLSWPVRLLGCGYQTAEALRAHSVLWGANQPCDIVVPFPMANNVAEATILSAPEEWLKTALASVNAINSPND
jgi:hypothetical protein